MIGTGYWSTGIDIALLDDRWSVTLDFFDDGFVQHASTEGELRCRYLVDDLDGGVDTLVDDALRLGIVFKPESMIFYKGDGEDPNYPAPPNRIEILNAQAQRLIDRGLPFTLWKVR